MAANRTDPPARGAEPASAPTDTAAAPPAGAGLKTWLPLAVTLVAMPALAWAMTTYVLVPRLQAGLGLTPPTETSKGHGEENAAEKGKDGKTAPRELYSMSKVMVNVSGTLGARYLLTSFSLVGSAPEFRATMESHDAQLRDLACGILSAKTIADIEKPTARNVIRSELLSAFNTALGSELVQEIYLTDLAIQ